jgi:RNA polymerase sigma-70 factor (ECF subfamily)
MTNPSSDGSSTSVTLLSRLKYEPGDQGAWSLFVDRYGPRVLAWCRVWGLQDADARDLTQVVLEKLLVRIQGFDYDPARSFRGWLRKLTRRAWVDSIAKKWPAVPGGDPRILSVIEGQEAREDLVKRLEREFDHELKEMAEKSVQDQVAPRTWLAYQLTAVEGLSGLEVSQRLGMSVANVFMARSNVLKRLREEVKKLESRQGDL